MISYFKQSIFAKIGLLFFSATLALILSAYYFFDWSAAPSDNILDAHDAYYHYKLIDSWGTPPDTLRLLPELNNLHLNAAIFYDDQDMLCENDTLLYWSNFNDAPFLCDYSSFSDSKFLSKEHNIDFPAYVSFGDIYINNAFQQATLVEFDGYKYLLVVDFLFPNVGFNVFPLLLLSVVFMCLLYVLVGQLLSPISLIEKRIVRLEGGDLDSKIKVSGYDELAILSSHINKMVGELKVLLNQKERLLSDVSHELRSPLAKMRLSLAMVPHHEKIVATEKQIKTLDSLITNILLSDQMSAPYSNLDLADISINKLIQNALDLTFVKNITTKALSDFEINVDSVKLAVAIKNLVENAYKYGNEKNPITISYIKKTSFFSIIVDDCGPGIPKEMVDEIKKAFVRGKENKGSGFGLGLSICDKVARAHGGSLLIENNRLGGTSCILRLPNEIK